MIGLGLGGVMLGKELGDYVTFNHIELKSESFLGI